MDGAASPSNSVIKLYLDTLHLVSAHEGGSVPEGDPGAVRHTAAAEVQHHHQGAAQGGVQGAEQAAVLPGHQVKTTSPDTATHSHRLVREVVWQQDCRNTVQHLCEELYTIPAPVTPRPIFSPARPSPPPDTAARPLPPPPSQPPRFRRQAGHRLLHAAVQDTEPRHEDRCPTFYCVATPQ